MPERNFKAGMEEASMVNTIRDLLELLKTRRRTMIMRPKDADWGNSLINSDAR